MKRFGLRAAYAAIVTNSARGRIYALAPAVAILGLAIGASALAPHGARTEPIEVLCTSSPVRCRQ